MSHGHRDFESAKAEGTAAEWFLLDLLADHRWLVAPNQINWDLAGGLPCAARAFGPGVFDLPDLDAMTPANTFRIGIESKSKEARRKDGSFGWDLQAFNRARRWGLRVQAPVLYAIRDRSIAPMPSDRKGPDDPDAWLVASLAHLEQSESERITRWGETRDGDPRPYTTSFWSRTVFTPLSAVLDGGLELVDGVLRLAGGERQVI